MGYAFWRNFFIMSFILSPMLILCGMILFSGKPKDLREKEEQQTQAGKGDSQ